MPVVFYRSVIHILGFHGNNHFKKKVIKTKEMTENSCTSNDCRFTYMLDFILKPGGKLEYQDNASLLKFKGNRSIDTCRKSGWKFVCE